MKEITLICLALIIGFLICKETIKPIVKTETKIDTVLKYVEIAPIQIKGHTSYIKTFVPDTSNIKKVDSLLSLLEFYKSELFKLDYKETAVLDTIVNNDTIVAAYETYAKNWFLDIRLSDRPVKVEMVTVTKTETKHNFYYYAGAFGAGIITGLLIK